MKKIIIAVFLVMATMTGLYGQSLESATADGKEVILNSTGTWKYVKVKKKTVLNPADSNNWIITKTDEVTGKTISISKNTLIISSDGGESGFGIFMMKGSASSLILVIHVVGAGSCIDKGNKINILFTDGSGMELFSECDFNCKGSAKVYFHGRPGKKDQLNQLKSKKIKTMRVWTRDTWLEKDFTSENQDEFLNVINCLAK